MRKFLVAPFDMHARLLAFIEREVANARRGLPARVIAKFNSLVEPQLIEALYKASQAGVKVDLIVRGICCLRPGVVGLSDNITVRSIVDRFLEHSRIYYFENACQAEVYIGSADWMPRNLFRRIETVFPIEDGNVRERIVSEVLGVSLADTVKARFLGPDGVYRRALPVNGHPPRRSQFEFISLATADDSRPTVNARGRTKYPQVKLASSPFGARGKVRKA
jgi:polyphosphate kinase